MTRDAAVAMVICALGAVLCAGEALSRMYGGHRDTFRSRSVRAQLDEGGHLVHLNALRQHFGMAGTL